MQLRHHVAPQLLARVGPAGARARLVFASGGVEATSRFVRHGLRLPWFAPTRAGAGATPRSLAIDGLKISDTLQLHLEPLRATSSAGASTTAKVVGESVALLIGRVVLAVAIPAADALDGQDGKGAATESLAVPSYVVDYSVERVSAQLDGY